MLAHAVLTAASIGSNKDHSGERLSLRLSVGGAELACLGTPLHSPSLSYVDTDRKSKNLGACSSGTSVELH